MAHGVTPAPRVTGQLRREVGLTSLMFISLGSIIGSGWLLGALLAAQIAGPASLLVVRKQSGILRIQRALVHPGLRLRCELRPGHELKIAKVPTLSPEGGLPVTVRRRAAHPAHVAAV